MECIAKEKRKLGPFGANVLRGKFGAEFRRLVCIGKSSDCLKCLVRTSCPYAVIFEPSPPPLTKVMRKYESIPRPFVIYFPFGSLSLNEGDLMSIDLTLIGKANEYLPYFVYCFSNILKKLGFELQHVLFNGRNLLKGDSIDIPSNNYNYLKFEIDGNRTLFSVELIFESPIRLIFKGELQEKPSFSALMRNFFRRITLLDYFYCGGSGEYPFKEVLGLVDQVNLIEASLSEDIFKRFSRRQKREIPLYGVTGRARYEPVPGFLLPYLKSMKDIHVGKNTTFGFGKVTLGELSLLNKVS